MSENASNQEFYASNEVNDFHSSVDARSLSVDSSKGGDEEKKTIENTLTKSAPHLTASLIAGGVSTTAVVVTGVLVLSPRLSALPKISSLALEATSVSVSYSFDCAYSGTGSLVLRLSSAFDEKSATLALIEESTSSSSEVVSSVSVSSSASNKTNQRRFAGVFDSLRSGTVYALTIQTPLTDNTYTTLSQKNVTTLAEQAVTLSFKDAQVDYAKNELLFSLAYQGSSSLPALDHLHLHLTGKDPSGSAHEEESVLSGTYQDSQSASLAGFMKGYYLRLSLLGPNEDNSAGDPAKKYAEMALYY